MKHSAPQRSFPAIGLAVLIALATAAPALALPKKEPWIELRTANFTLFSNAGEKTVRRVGADLERLRDALSQLVPGLALSSPSPTYLFVFKNANAFKPYQRAYNGKALESGGYFLARQLANYVAVNSDQHGDERLIIYHEYLHYVLRNNYASLPLWFHEGLAEYYSTFNVGKDEARIGLPIAEHVAWLRQNPLIPLSSLFAVDEHSQDYNETDRRGGFYAESWALVHYLISGSPERRLQTVESLRLAQAGTPPDQIFKRAFGADSAALERELRKYVQGYLFASTRVPIRAEANLAMEARPMAWADVLYRLGDLLANMSTEQAPAAAEHFRAALAEQPDHGPALAGLGYLEELAGRPEAARPWYEKAAKLAPDDFHVQYLYARNLLEDPGPDALQKARAALSTAVRLRPDFGEAWARLGYTWQVAEELPPEAIQAMETAGRLLPSRMDVAHNLAIAYARTGQREKAEALIENVLAPRADPEMVANAREALVALDYARAEELVGQEKLEEALPLLEQIRDRTHLDSRKVEITARITEIREAQSFNRFVDRYNQAVDLANQGDVRGALAILEPLIETTRDPVQAERARTLAQRLKGPEKKRGGSRPL
ncbi:MAG TPA: tetratricopeptide repeat protein [Thermoanaerobaculia bacterium]|jgi:tetratricopeptide (TPR) repeat protein|nr:tetratricopeptide repeat protein [Thermoanaerobaculia bacterium]